MTTTHDAPASVTTAASAPEGYELRAVDPATLVDNPQNARRPHRDREGLAPSIGALGILNPPLVRQLEDGRLEIIAGERRKYSAIKAGLSTIPVFVRDDLSPVHQLAGMLVENHDREGLTPTEEAVAIQQLAGFEGVTQRDITTMTGIKAGVVRTALKVAASEVATAIGERHDLNLDQLMVLAEFDTDTEAVKALTVTALKDPEPIRPPGGPAPARPRRPCRLRRRSGPGHRGRGAPGRAGERLVAPRGRPTGSRTFRPRAVPAPSPRPSTGPAPVTVPPWSRPTMATRLAYLCLDPVGHGHIDQATARTATTSPATDAPASGMTDEQKDERRKVIANNKAWETATPVRREFVTELVARRSVPKGTLRYVTEVIMADPAGLAAGDGDRVASLIGKDTNPGRAWDRTAALALASDASDARLPLVLFAQVAASVEARFGERQGWRHPDVGSRGLPQIPRHLRLRTLRGRTGGSRHRGRIPRRRIERLVPSWQQPRLSRGCCASPPVSRPAGHARTHLTGRRQEHAAPHSTIRPPPHPSHLRSPTAPIPSRLPNHDHSCLSRPISHIRLLHTCGIRGGVGLAARGRGGRPPSGGAGRGPSRRREYAVISLRRMTLGSGYRYLMESVAVGDGARGKPPT